MYRRTYSWNHNYNKYYCTLDIPDSLYNFYKNKPRLDTADYSAYIFETADELIINDLIKYFRKIQYGSGFEEIDILSLILSFVQSFRYIKELNEYPNYPIETLCETGGDCEDTSILLAKIYHQMDYEVALLYLKEHCAVGIACDTEGSYLEFEGVNYFYCESTGKGWKIGAIPNEYKHQRIRIEKVKPKPMYSMGFNAQYSNLEAELNIRLINVGSLVGKCLTIQGAFDANDKYLYNPEKKYINLIYPDETKEIKLRLKTPRNRSMRFIVQLIHNDRILSQKYSDWFST